MNKGIFKFRVFRRRRTACRIVAAFSAFAMLCVASLPAFAAPTAVLDNDLGGAAFNYIKGATHNQIDADHATFTASGQGGLIDWQALNVGSGQGLNFQGNQFFNVVSGGDRSQIAGTLEASGALWIFNPAGVSFLNGANVTAGGLFAVATANLANKSEIEAAIDGGLDIPAPVLGETGAGAVSTVAGSVFNADRLAFAGRSVNVAGGDFTKVGRVAIGAADKMTVVDDVAGGKVSINIAEFTDDTDVLGDIGVTLGDVDFGGTKHAGNLAVVTEGSINVKGAVKADGDIVFKSLAGEGASAPVISYKKMSVASGKLLQGKSVSASAAGRVQIDGEINATGDEAGVDIESGLYTTINGSVTAVKDVVVAAQGNVNVAGSVESTGGSVAISAAGVGKSVKVGWSGSSLATDAVVFGATGVEMTGKISSQVLAGEVKAAAGDVSLSGGEYVAVAGKATAESGNVSLSTTESATLLSDVGGTTYKAGDTAGVLVLGTGSVEASGDVVVESVGAFQTTEGTSVKAGDSGTLSVDAAEGTDIGGDFTTANMTIAGNEADVTISKEIDITGDLVIDNAANISVESGISANDITFRGTKTTVAGDIAGNDLAVKTADGTANADLKQTAGVINVNSVTAANIEQTGGTMTAADYIKADGEIKQNGDNATTVMSAKTIEATTVGQTGGKIVASEKVKADVTQSGCEIDTPEIQGNLTQTDASDVATVGKVTGAVVQSAAATLKSSASYNDGNLDIVGKLEQTAEGATVDVSGGKLTLGGALTQSGGKIVADTAYLHGGADQTGGAVEIGSLRFVNAGYDVSLSSAGNKIGNVHGTVKNLTLVDSEGGIVIGKSGLPESQNSLIVNGNAEITANGGGITQDGKISVAAGDATFKADGDIALDHGWNVFGGKVNADGGNILIAAGANVANMTLGDVKATGDARAKVLTGDLTVDGGVDADGNVRLESVEGGVIVSGTVNGNNVTLAAANGITENAEVNAAADKYVHATDGNINVNATATVGGDVAYVANKTTGKIVTGDGATIGSTGGGTTYKSDSTATIAANGSMTSKDGVTTFKDASVVAIDTTDSVVVENDGVAVTVGEISGGASVTEVLADPSGGPAADGTDTVALDSSSVSGITAKDVAITVTGAPGDIAVSVEKAIATTDGDVSIATDNGDVNVQANVAATGGDVTVDAGGNVRVKGDVSGENVDIDAGGFVQVNGGKKVSATDAAAIYAGGSVTVLGTVEGKTVSLLAGTDDASKSIKVQGAAAYVSGTDSVTMTGGKSVQVLGGAKVESDGTVEATADEYIAVNGTVSGKTGVTLETTTKDTLTSAVGGFPAGAPAGVIVQEGTVESAEGAVAVTSKGSVMVDGDSAVSGKSVSLTANGEDPGQGVQIAGDVTATGGDVDIDAAGVVTVDNATVAAEGKVLVGDTTTPSGSFEAKNGATVTGLTGVDVNVSGRADVNGATVTAGVVNPNGSIGAGSDADLSMTAGKNVKIEGGATVAASGTATVTANGNDGSTDKNGVEVTGTGTKLVADKNMTVQATTGDGNVVIKDGAYVAARNSADGNETIVSSANGSVEVSGAVTAVEAGKELTITGAKGVTVEAAKVGTDGALALNATGDDASVTVQGGASALGKKGVTVDSAKDVVVDGALVKAGSFTVDESNGNVTAFEGGDNAALNVTAAGNVEVKGNSQVGASGTATVVANGVDGVSIASSKVAAKDTVNIDANGGGIVIDKSYVGTHGEARLTASKDVEIRDVSAVVESTGDMTIKAISGDVTVGEDARIGTSGNLEITAGGTTGIKAEGVLVADEDGKTTTLTAENGAIDAQNADNDFQSLTATAKSVTLNDKDDITLTEVVSKDGDVRVKATTGNLTVADATTDKVTAPGDIRLEAADGAITVGAGVKGNNVTVSANGNVTTKKEDGVSNGTLSANNGGDLLVESTDGNIVLAADASAADTAALFAEKGSINAAKIDAPTAYAKGKGDVTIGDVTGTLVMTTEGNIDVEFKDDADHTIAYNAGGYVNVKAKGGLVVDSATPDGADLKVTEVLWPEDTADRTLVDHNVADTQVSGVTAGKEASLESTASSIEVRTGVDAGTTASLNAKADVTVFGTVSGKTGVTIDADGDVTVDGAVVKAGVIDETTGEVSGEAANLAIAAGGAVTVDGGAKVGSSGATAIDAASGVTVMGASYVGANTTLDVGTTYGKATASLTVQDSSQLVARDNLTAKASGAVVAEGGAKVASDAGVDLDGETVTVQDGAKVLAEGGIGIAAADAVTVDDAAVAGKTGVTVDAGGDVTVDGAVVKAGEFADEATGAVKSGSNADLAIAAGNGVTVQNDATVAATGTAEITASGAKGVTVKGTDTKIVADKSLTVQTTTGDGSVVVSEGAYVAARNSVDGNTVTISSEKGSVTVSGAATAVEAGKDLTLTAKTGVMVDAAKAGSDKTLKLEATGDESSVNVNGGAKVLAAEDIDIDAKGAVLVDNATVAAKGDVLVGDATTRAGSFTAQKGATVAADAGSVSVYAKGDATVDGGTTSVTANNGDVTIDANGNVEVKGATVAATGGDATLTAGKDDSIGKGRIDISGTVAATATDDQNNPKGGNVTLTAKGADVADDPAKSAVEITGTVTADQKAAINATVGGVDVKGGTVVANGKDDANVGVAINAGTDVTVSGTAVAKGGDATVDAAGKVEVAGGKVLAVADDNAETSGSVAMTAGASVELTDAAEVNADKAVTITANGNDGEAAPTAVHVTGTSTIEAVTSVTVNSTSAGDITVDTTKAVTANDGNVTIDNENGNVTVKNAAVEAKGDNGSVDIDAKGNVVIEKGTQNAVVKSDKKDVLIEATDGYISIKDATVTSGNNLRLGNSSTAEGNVTIDAGVTLVAGQNATIEAQRTVEIKSDVTATAGTIDVEATNGSIVMADGSTVKTTDQNIRLRSKGGITMEKIDAKGGSVTLDTDGDLVMASDDAKVTADGLAVNANKVGTAKDKMKFSVSKLAVDSATDIYTDIYVDNDKSVTVTSAGGEDFKVVRVKPDGTEGFAPSDEIKINGVVAKNGDVDLDVTSGDLVVDSGSAISSTGVTDVNVNGALVINGQISGGTTSINAGGDLTVNGNVAGASLVKAGGSVNVNGSMQGGNVNVEAGNDIAFDEDANVSGADVTLVAENGSITQSDATITATAGRVPDTKVNAAVTASGKATLTAENGSIGSVGTSSADYVGVEAGSVAANAGGDAAIADPNGDGLVVDDDGIEAGRSAAVYTAGTVSGSGTIAAPKVTISAKSYDDADVPVKISAGSSLTVNNFENGMNPLLAIFESNGGSDRPNLANLPNKTVVFFDGRLLGGDLQTINTVGSIEAFPVQTPELKSEQGIFGNPVFLHDELDVANPLAVGAIDFLLLDIPRLTLSSDFPLEVEKQVAAAGLNPTTSYWFGQKSNETEEKEEDSDGKPSDVNGGNDTPTTENQTAMN